MIKSVQKALNILKVLSDTPFEYISLKDISIKTKIEKSTCHHILETLCAEGFAQNTAGSGKYILGPDAYLLTRFGKYNETLISVCHPLLTFLARKTQKTVLLAVLANNQKFIIDKIDSNENIFSHNAQIFTDDIYRTATGRILMSHMTRDEVFKLFQKYGTPKNEDWEGIDSFSALCSALKAVKKQQYVKTVSQISDNLSHVGLGKAILKDGKCVGAIGIACSAAPPHNADCFSATDLNFFLRTAAEINRRLKFY
ncbi:MAG: helix-turn-helix domain-containing protein [Clostridia bacterium]|nr:helix-turn-helix domain-containing protein [Clostridia bacterium]